MVNEQVIERLQRGDWVIECNNAEEVDLVLHACDDAEIKEESGEKATKIKRYYKYPIFIGYPEASKGIEISLKERYEALNMENITDLFFNAVNTPTPLPTSREMWGFIDKKWRFMAMDRSKLIYLYEEKPTASDGMWLPEDGSYSQCPLNINTDGINWETSLTERPEGV